MLIHCNMKIQPRLIQFLYDDELFTDRRLEIGNCPKCDKLLARLVEKRKVDGRTFEGMYSEGKAQRCINDCSSDIMFTSDDLQVGKKVLCGWRYGENTEKIDKKTGEKIIVQKACDFFGNKERISPII